MRPLILSVLFLCAACDDKSISLGRGAPPDARLLADMYTWECTSAEDELYEGVFAYQLSLEYAPDGLEDRELPASGCTRGLDLFPGDAGGNGLDIPDVDSPGWATADINGVLDHVTDGFYYDNVFDNRSGCQDAAELLAEGTTLSDAGSFSGATAPSPGSLEDVALVGTVDEETGIPFGSEVTATWDAHGWDDSFVQIRREKDGALVESVTCATDEDGSFTVDDDVWSLLSGALEVDVTNLYVGFQVDGGSETADGQQILTSTRAMHVAVVQD
jgi:hypothetical protein